MVAVGGTAVGVAVRVGDEHAEISIMPTRKAPNSRVILLFLFIIVVTLLAFTFMLQFLDFLYISDPTYFNNFIDYTNAKIFVEIVKWKNLAGMKPVFEFENGWY